MQHLLWSLIGLTSTQISIPVEPVCPKLHLDLRAGTLNGVSPLASMDEIKRTFPCFTGDSPEGSSWNCGGGVFFLNHDFYFYTAAGFLDVRGDFKGTVSDGVMGMSRKRVERVLGRPVAVQQDAVLYKTKYGTLAVTFDGDGMANRLEVFFWPPGSVILCR
jgi:hypothetical protein